MRSPVAISTECQSLILGAGTKHLPMQTSWTIDNDRDAVVYRHALARLLTLLAMADPATWWQVVDRCPDDLVALPMTWPVWTVVGDVCVRLPPVGMTVLEWVKCTEML